MTLLLAVVVGVAPLPPALIERHYSSTVYPGLQHVLTSASNATSLVLLDFALAGAVVVFLVSGLRDFTKYPTARAAARAAWRALVSCASIYLAFLLLWGFNYRRVPLDARLAFDARAVTSAAAVRLASISVERLNGLYAPAHREGWGSVTLDGRLATTFRTTMKELGVTAPATLSRPKLSLLDWYFRRAGVAGMTDPFFLETLVASDLLSFERPFVIAHEWSHIAGLADEGEANLAGWLACARSQASDQYSGWLFLYGEILPAIRAEQADIASRLQPGPREDLKAIRERLARNISPRVSAAGWRAYDSYLKVNRVEAGAASYEEVVRLALGLRAAQVY